MDSDDGKKNKILKGKREPYNFLQRYITNVSDVLSPIWVRRIVQIDNGHEWFILGCRYRFLFNFRLFLVVLYFFYEINK